MSIFLDVKALFSTDRVALVRQVTMQGAVIDRRNTKKRSMNS